MTTRYANAAAIEARGLSAEPQVGDEVRSATLDDDAEVVGFRGSLPVARLEGYDCRIHAGNWRLIRRGPHTFEQGEDAR